MLLAEARAELAEHRNTVQRGGDPAAERDKRRAELTLGELLERYQREHSDNYKRASTRKADAWYLKLLPHAWLAKSLSVITCLDMQAEHRRITKGGSPYNANHLMRLLRHAYSKAIEWKLYAGDNPVKGLHFNAEVKRTRFMSIEEIAAMNVALLAVKDWRWRCYFPLTLRFGTRRGELLKARWVDVDFKRRIFTIPSTNTKNGRPHEIAFDDGVEAMLWELPSFEKSEWIFPSAESASGHLESPSDAWQRIRKSAGVPDVRIHDLRHTYASHMRLAGQDLMMIKEALNHKSIATTQRYMHVSQDERREAGTATARAMGLLEATADDSGRRHFGV
jgi:integrase